MSLEAFDPPSAHPNWAQDRNTWGGGVGLGGTFVGAQQRGTWSHRWPQ